MNKKAVVCTVIAAFFIGLAVGLNVGHNVLDEMPTIVTVVLIVVGCFFGGLAANFNQTKGGRT